MDLTFGLLVISFDRVLKFEEEKEELWAMLTGAQDMEAKQLQQPNLPFKGGGN